MMRSKKKLILLSKAALDCAEDLYTYDTVSEASDAIDDVLYCLKKLIEELENE